MSKNLKRKIAVASLLLAVMAQPMTKSFANDVNVAVEDDNYFVHENFDEVNNYLRGLDYDPEDLLVHNGETISNKFPKYGKVNNGEFIVVEKIKKSITNKNSDVAVMTANDDRVYPGALLKADKGLLENNPTLISLERAPMKVSIDLPGMVGGDSSELVVEPKSSSLRDAVNSLTSRWIANYQGSYSSVPAKIEYTETMVKSMNQLKTQFGLGFEKLGVPLKIDFDSLVKGEKQAAVVHLKQIYFNVSVDAPSQPAKFFAENVRAIDLITAGITAQTPPVYVSNVAYGRSMYIKFETTSKSANVQAAFQAVIKGVDVNANSEFKSILDKTTFTAVILGGSADGATKVISGGIDELKNVIAEGSNYSRHNPAVPVAYRTSFVKDNAPATFLNNTDYVETKITSYKNGELTLRHRGAYIAKFFVNWEEISYDENGNEIRTKKSWEDNGKPRTAGFTVTIPLKGNVRNLDVKAIEKTGLVWEPWRTVYNKQDLPLARKRTISIWGTTLNPKSGEEIKND